MSCSAIAIPIALCYILPFVIGGAADIIDKTCNINSKNCNINDISFVPGNSQNSSDILYQTKFETPFVDKELLIKTLSEHGGEITENKENSVKFQIEKFILDFSREDINLPFSLTIKHTSRQNPQEKFTDISQEYTLNVQEQSYQSIVEKLKENNMQIEEEEIEEDNTIVLTINLD